MWPRGSHFIPLVLQFPSKNADLTGPVWRLNVKMAIKALGAGPGTWWVLGDLQPKAQLTSGWGCRAGVWESAPRVSRFLSSHRLQLCEPPASRQLDGVFCVVGPAGGPQIEVRAPWGQLSPSTTFKGTLEPQCCSAPGPGRQQGTVPSPEPAPKGSQSPLLWRAGTPQLVCPPSSPREGDVTTTPV